MKIKFPTLITGPLESHHWSYHDMINDVVNKINAYNNLASEDKAKIPFRGKSKVKVLRAIHNDNYNIGTVPCVQICVDEYKEGYDNMYLQKRAEQSLEINLDDRIGSDRNYALLYPLIPNDEDATNSWLVIIFDTPNKDDSDIINTIKYTIKTVLGFSFRFAYPRTINGLPVVPKIEVSYVTVENENNEGVNLSQFIVSNKIQTTKKTIYENVPSNNVDPLLEDSRSAMGPNMRCRIKMFFDQAKKNAYKKYDYKVDDYGNIRSEIAAKYSYEIEVGVDDMPQIYDNRMMKLYFTDVVNNFLTNGMH